MPDSIADWEPVNTAANVSDWEPVEKPRPAAPLPETDTLRGLTTMETIRGYPLVRKILGDPGMPRDITFDRPTGLVPALFSTPKYKHIIPHVDNPKTIGEGLQNIAANVVDSVATPGGIALMALGGPLAADYGVGASLETGAVGSLSKALARTIAAPFVGTGVKGLITDPLMGQTPGETVENLGSKLMDLAMVAGATTFLPERAPKPVQTAPVREPLQIGRGAIRLPAPPKKAGEFSLTDLEMLLKQSLSPRMQEAIAQAEKAQSLKRPSMGEIPILGQGKLGPEFTVSGPELVTRDVPSNIRRIGPLPEKEVNDARWILQNEIAKEGQLKQADLDALNRGEDVGDGLRLRAEAAHRKAAAFLQRFDTDQLLQLMAPENAFKIQGGGMPEIQPRGIIDMAAVEWMRRKAGFVGGPEQQPPLHEQLQAPYPLNADQLGLRGELRRPRVPEFGETKPQPVHPEITPERTPQEWITAAERKRLLAGPLREPMPPKLPEVYQPKPGTPLRTKAQIAAERKANALQVESAEALPVRQTSGSGGKVGEGIPEPEKPAGTQAAQTAPSDVPQEVTPPVPAKETITLYHQPSGAVKTATVEEFGKALNKTIRLDANGYVMAQDKAGNVEPIGRWTKDEGSEQMPVWVREEMKARGLDPARTFNDVDLQNQSVRDAIRADPTLTDEQKSRILETGSISTVPKTPTINVKFIANSGFHDTLNKAFNKIEGTVVESKGDGPVVGTLRQMIKNFDAAQHTMSRLEREGAMSEIKRHRDRMQKENIQMPPDLAELTSERIKEFYKPSPSETPEEQISGFIIARGAKPFTAPLRRLGRSAFVKFEYDPTGDAAKPWKATVFDSPTKEASAGAGYVKVETQRARFLKSVIRPIHEKYDIALESATHEPMPEPMLAPEYRQESIKRGLAAADEILKGKTILRLKDVREPAAKLIAEADRLGFVLEDPWVKYGQYHQGDYEALAQKFKTEVRKKFGDAPTAEGRGESFDPPVEKTPAAEPPKPTAAPTAESILSKPMGETAFDSLPDQVVNDVFDAKKPDGSPQVPPHVDGVFYGLKNVYPGIVEHMQKIIRKEVEKAKAAATPAASGDPVANQMYKAAFGRQTWAAGVIEGVRKDGPNYRDAMDRIKIGQLPDPLKEEKPAPSSAEPENEPEPPESTRLYTDPFMISPLVKPIETFINKDVVPALKKGVDATKAGIKSIVDLFSPATRTPTRNVDILFESKGYKEKLYTEAASAVEGVHGQFERMTEPQRIDFIDRIKRGVKQPTKELQDTAELLRKWDDRLYDEFIQYKPGLPYLENHLRVLWKVIPGSPEAMKGLSKEQIASKRPWRGSQGFTRRHVLDDMSEGIALGGVPVTTNPVEMFLLHAQDVMKFVAANRAWDGLKKLGQVEFVKNGKTPPPGYSRINDSIAKAYFKTEEGMLAKSGEWWVEDGAARMINNYLSRDLIRGNSIGRGLIALKNMTTAIELGLSPFHALFEANEVMGSSLGLGFAKLWEGDPSGLADIHEFMLSPKTTSSIGKAAIQFAKNAEQFRKADPQTYDWFVKKFPEARQLIDDLFTGGGQIEMHQDYRVKWINSFRKAVAENNNVGAVVRAFPALNEVAMKPLFETYIPRLKVGMFLREYAFELSRHADDLTAGKMTRPELARRTWSFIEDRFGELNWDNLYWDRTFKSAMQLAFRSVTWKLGNLRGFGKAGRDATAELGYNWWKEGRYPRITLPMGWLIGMSIVTAIQSTVITYAATGKYPWDLAKDAKELARNIVFPRIDNADASQRVSIPTYWRDAVHLSHSMPDYIKSSMTGEWGRIADVWNNRDFYGVEIYHPDDPTQKKIYDGMTHMIPLPFGLSSYIAAERTGASGARKAFGFMGYTKAPYYVSYSPAEKLAYKFIREQQPIGSRTAEEFQRGVHERIAVDAIKRGELTLQQAIEQGVVEKNRRDLVKARAKESPLQHAVKSLRAEDGMKVWSEATPEERQSIRRMLKQKVRDSESLKPEMRREYLNQLQPPSEQLESHQPAPATP